MKTLIVYDSVFGNTKEIAEEMAKGLKGGAEVVRVSEVTESMVYSADMILVGSPTRAFSPTPAITAWLKALNPADVKGKPAAAFDTRMDSETLDSDIYSFFEGIFRHAAERIEKRLKKKGADIRMKREGFVVLDSQGPLRDGETNRASVWAAGLNG